MRVSEISGTKFNGKINITPTCTRLLKTCDRETSSKFYNLMLQISKINDKYEFTFGNSIRGERPIKSRFISLMVEKAIERGERVPLLVKEIRGNYKNIDEACKKNPNILEYFVKAIQDFYSIKEINEKTIDWHDAHQFYKTRKPVL